jgi:hypothetical protein
LSPAARTLSLVSLLGVRRAVPIVVGFLGVVASGCVGTTGHLALATTRNITPADLNPDAPRRHVIGRSCIDLIVVFPTAMPNFGDAVESALRQTDSQLLTDVTIRYEIRYFPLVYGIACYVAEGDAR